MSFPAHYAYNNILFYFYFNVFFRKKFVCHHSTFMKVPAKDNKRGLSKNANCQASILVVIKLNTINTRQKDAFIKVR